MRHFIPLACALVAVACAEPDDPAAVDASAGDAAVDSAVSDAEPIADAVYADGGSCDPDRTWNWVANRPIQPGDFCDDVQLCAADAEAAALITAAMPELECGEPAGQGGCTAGQLFCQWSSPDIIDDDEWAGLCAITVMDEPPTIRCLVYL